MTLPYQDIGINMSTEQRLAGREDSEGEAEVVSGLN